MMCEDCGMNPAVFHFIAINGEERTEKNLCAECMRKYEKRLPGMDLKDLAGLLSNLIDERRTSREESEQETDIDITCEQCGMTYREFRKCGMFGCAECYHAFREPLTALLQRIHGNTQHAGRVPDGTHSGASIRINIDRLRQQLLKAVAAEEYEKAAGLRDAIRSLEAQLKAKESKIHVEPPRRIDEGRDGDFDA